MIITRVAGRPADGSSRLTLQEYSRTSAQGSVKSLAGGSHIAAKSLMGKPSSC